MTKLGDSGEVAGETDHYTVVGLEEEAEVHQLLRRL